MPTMLEHAIALSDNGLRVFPVHYPVRTLPNPVCSCSRGPECKHIGKHPATKRGFTDATMNHDEINRLWRDRKYNIGVPTGTNSFDVLDEDVQHQGDLSLQQLITQYGPLPASPRTKTGGGGHHYLYQHIPGTRNDNHGKIGKGLDFKTDGGYIVAPPSLHVSGSLYAWEVTVTGLPIAPAPTWLVDIMRGPDQQPNTAYRRPRRQPEFWYRLAQGNIAEGGRSDAITSLTGLLLDLDRLDPRLAITLIHSYNHRCCEPPLSRDEVASIISSITKKIAN